MTEASEASSATDAEVVRAINETTFPFDPDLQRLVDLVNIVETMEVGITVHVSGAVVSGMLISNAQFYRLLIKEITGAQALKENEKGNFANFYRFPLDAIENDLKVYKETGKPPLQARHLHIRYAQTFVSAREPVIASLWRGRLTAVDGWSMGNLGSIAPLPSDDN